jgi:PAS domain S-box-containing protein
MTTTPAVNRLPDILSASLESLPLGVLMIADDGAIVLVNRVLESMLGYQGAELVGRSIDVLVPDEQRAAFLRQPDARTMAAGREIFALCKDGSEMPVDVRLASLRIEGREYVLASLVDLTERRRAEAALRQVLDERIAFESLISDLAAQFVNLLSDDVDRTIEQALARLVTALDLDRSSLFQVVDDTGDFVHTHQWTRPGREAPPARVSARERFPWHLSKLLGGEMVSFSAIDDVPDELDRQGLRALGTRSGVTIPLVVRGRTWGALTFAAMEPRSWPPDVVTRLRVVASLFANVLARKQNDEGLRRAMAGDAQQRARLREENMYLRHELNAFVGAPAIVGHSAGIRRALEQVRQAAPGNATVVLTGEIGTGKSLLANHIHELSPRRERAMVRVKCAAVSAAWPEGLLNIVEGSTVFFDEIADLSLDAQVSLARVMQSRDDHGRNGAGTLAAGVRVIAATRRNLLETVQKGSFREDLYYQINVLSIHLPPLRERPEDVPLLTWRFVDEFSETYGKTIDTIDHESMRQLQRHTWPGNARELRNVVERAMIRANGRRLQIALPPGAVAGREIETLADVEKAHIAAVLAACGGRIVGPGGAAARLGITPRALETRIRRLAIRPGRGRR